MSSGPTTGGGGGVSSSTGQGGGGGMVPLGPWSMPQIVGPLSHDADDDDPSMTADGLEVFFDTIRSGNPDIWVSKRNSVNDPWGMPTSVDELNSLDTESNQTVSPDGLTMYIPSNRDDPLAPSLIYRATRLSRSSAWSMPMLDDELNQRNLSEVGSITENGLMLVGSLCANNTCDLVILERATTSSPWGAPQPIAEINTADTESEAWLHPQGTAIFFESNRPGAMGGWDLMFSLRASIAEPFDPPEFIAELASMQSEGDANLLPNLRYILFSMPAGPNGEREIFESSR